MGQYWKEPKLGGTVMCSVAEVRDGAGEILEGATPGSRCEWMAVDYRDRLKLPDHLASAMGLDGPAVEEAQCMVLHVVGAFLAARQRAWPTWEEVQMATAGYRGRVHRVCLELKGWPGAVGPTQNLGESEVRLHAHPATVYDC